MSFLFKSLPSVFRSLNHSTPDATWENKQHRVGRGEDGSSSAGSITEETASEEYSHGSPNRSHDEDELGILPTTTPAFDEYDNFQQQDGERGVNKHEEGDEDDDDDDEGEEFDDEPGMRYATLLSPDVYALYEWQKRYQRQKNEAYIEQSEDEAFSYTVEENEDEQDLENFVAADDMPLDGEDADEWSAGGHCRGEPDPVLIPSSSRSLAWWGWPIWKREHTGSIPVQPPSSSQNSTTRQQDSIDPQDVDEENIVGHQCTSNRGKQIDTKNQRTRRKRRKNLKQIQPALKDAPSNKGMDSDSDVLSRYGGCMALGAMLVGFLIVLTPWLILDQRNNGGSNTDDSPVIDYVTPTMAPTLAPTIHAVIIPVNENAHTPANENPDDVPDVPSPTKDEIIVGKADYMLHLSHNVTLDLLVHISSKNSSTVLYQVTEDVVALNDTCTKAWSERATTLFQSRSYEFTPDVVLPAVIPVQIELLDGVDTLLVECQNDVATNLYYNVFVDPSEEEQGQDDEEESDDQVSESICGKLIYVKFLELSQSMRFGFRTDLFHNNTGFHGWPRNC